MTEQELYVLAAKDWVIKTHGRAVLKWSRQTWNAAVEGILRQFTDETRKNIKWKYFYD